ncbi:type II toxin-antitoxin system RelE/ParE family toxin [Brenneria tiliae]|uniref:Type II toxin-antitoxin system RelE/ParE family toxin n=1 Tax=Brenneria tiliae TaxID=2914984 RepID=A0ABT0MR19_9GAMM|nr:type II toxin-antitoxin system RelE/ParE family toxin [Brenneria tiliae]
MTSKVLWEKRARSDREAIFFYLYHQAGLQVASATDDRFVSMADILKKNPLTGMKAGLRKKQRKLVVPRFPFIIVYIVEDDTVHILRILHTSRRIAARYRIG